MDTPHNEDQFVKLHDLVIGSTNVSGFLAELSGVAASTLSDSAGSLIECGVTLRRRKRSATVAGSSDRARELDRLEQVLGDGPCLASLETMKPVVLADVQTDPRWPEYRKILADNGCRAVLGVPLALDDSQAAALNFFASEPGVFSDAVIRKAEGFADLAGRSLRLALKIADARNLAEDLSAAMQNRTTIDLACGVIMAQNRCSQEEAMALLTKASSHRNQKLRDLAADVLARVSSGAVTTHFDP
ncbi:ANTAR domain-containing protein [Pseudarthrobacter phenanthrenivorans]|uniref:ANTAR domain-containing protein n=2 Tax=Pseudarthrobacter phenanthrenivorans TaxID=361575 RepID=A0A3B0FN95_PSEPS|nr:GAF and ANTAR domain-containing protein [Pseudarthrobacter phenanthrenivorans]ADX71606.1 ANTAR/GAF domain-containing protein [Pseudarthrobacter phenanthrenivorans Sphe3]RKO21128.1 ANTAR domain-containing protein [Pseudarthrobacter phenanthrenivorans]TPV48812.1 GAF and ANTAR domain-containing protein [Pseudarthrobacter phenanthrenivorans]